MYSLSRNPLFRGTIVKYVMDRPDFFQEAYGIESPMADAGFVAGEYYVVVSSELTPLTLDNETVQCNMLRIVNLADWDSGDLGSLFAQPLMASLGWTTFPIHCFRAVVTGVSAATYLASAAIKKARAVHNPVRTMLDLVHTPLRQTLAQPNPWTMVGHEAWDEPIRGVNIARAIEGIEAMRAQFIPPPQARARRIELGTNHPTDPNYKYGEHFS